MGPDATGEEVRALIEVLWAQTRTLQSISEKLDKVLGIFGRQPDDPRYQGNPWGPR